MLSRNEVERLCALDALIVIDEAYVEFGAATAIPLLAKHPNLVILRTFSKWAGLAGLRVGYALCHPDLAACLIVAERERMSRLLGELGWLKPLPSAANFVLFEVHGRAASEVAAALRRMGVLVRYYNRPDLANYIRISAGRPRDTDRLLAALRTLEAA